MAHCKVLFVGTISNLNQIYADCPDSSSESCAEMAFSYDYLEEYPKEILLNKPYERFFNSSDYNDFEFTKNDTELYHRYIIKKSYYDCFDIRDNTSNHCISTLSNEEIDLFFKNLPDDTHFFVCDGHL